MKRKSSPLPPVLGTVATRTRRQEKAAAAKWNQPLSVILNILMYADPETVRVLCRVSKQFLDIIRNSPGMKDHRVIPLLQINASESEEDDGRPERLIHQLYEHHAELQRYRAIKFTDVKRFCRHSPPSKLSVLELSKTFQLHGVVSLDISSPTVLTEDDVAGDSIDLLQYLTAILPNLLEINCSNGTFDCHSMYYFCSRLCPRLERIKWNNIKFRRSDIGPHLCGGSMEDAKNLKEIYMDDCEFFCFGSERQRFMNLHGDPRYYIFHLFSKNKDLARLSIKNAVVAIKQNAMKNYQNMLIKFVRKAPSSLQWFRSDLTQGNIDMLQSERPGIELVS